MARRTQRYAEYVEHPRFGRYPRFTGLDVNANSPGVELHWINGWPTKADLHAVERLTERRIESYGAETRLIAGTAIKGHMSDDVEHF